MIGHDADAVSPLHAASRERGRDPRRPIVQLAPRPGTLPIDDDGVLRMTRHFLEEELVHSAVARVIGVGAVPLREDHLRLGRREHRDGGEGEGGIRERALEESDEVAAHPFDRLGVEERLVREPAHAELGLGLVDLQVEVELDVAVVERERLDRDARKREDASAAVQPAHGDLEDG